MVVSLTLSGLRREHQGAGLGSGEGRRNEWGWLSLSRNKQRRVWITNEQDWEVSGAQGPWGMWGHVGKDGPSLEQGLPSGLGKTRPRRCKGLRRESVQLSPDSICTAPVFEGHMQVEGKNPGP